MRRTITLTATLLAVLLTVTASAQVRGRGRLQGLITDRETGKPVTNATISIALPNGNTQPIVVKSDGKGHWAAMGMTTGLWNVDITADGYATSRGTANISEVQQLPMVQTKLSREVKQDAAVSAPASPLIPKEAVDAINEGQELMKRASEAPPSKLHAGDVITTTQATGDGTSKSVSHTLTAREAAIPGYELYLQAIADFEKALPMVPTDKPELKEIYSQLTQVMARAYYDAGDVKNAIAMLEKVTASDAANTAAVVLLANLYLEDGQLETGKALLEKLPPTAITDPTAYINVGILFLNKKNPADAVTYFSRAIGIDPKGAEGFYYRGLAYAQLKKTPEARADFEQVLAVAAAGSSEAKDAKAMLDALPKK